MTNFDKSHLWDSILESDTFKGIDINTFKNEGANSKITQYSHKTHSLLFFKNLLFQMAQKLGSDNLSLLKDIPNRYVGGGETICYENELLDLDYLLALQEIIFLKEKLKTIHSILEIGAGYGRTCHSILSLFPNITKYTIIDLPQMLDLSSRYLKIVGKDENFSKINFTPIDKINEEEYDLVINIDSMQEMNQETVESYLDYINHCGKAFYSQNTVGKFDPALFGWETTESSKLAMNSGILKNIVNIFCPTELKKAQKDFILNFTPGKDWVVEKHAATLPWAHYYQALFIKHV